MNIVFEFGRKIVLQDSPTICEKWLKSIFHLILIWNILDTSWSVISEHTIHGHIFDSKRFLNQSTPTIYLLCFQGPVAFTFIYVMYRSFTWFSVIEISKTKLRKVQYTLYDLFNMTYNIWVSATITCYEFSVT